jgi:hypothetical protein
MLSVNQIAAILFHPLILPVDWNKCRLRQFSIEQAIKTKGDGYESV